jgi:hypothetical protein
LNAFEIFFLGKFDLSFLRRKRSCDGGFRETSPFVHGSNPAIVTTVGIIYSFVGSTSLVDFSEIGRSLVLCDYDPTPFHPIWIGFDI